MLSSLLYYNMQMISSIERSVKVLVEVVGDAADPGRSVDTGKMIYTLFQGNYPGYSIW